MRGAILTQVAHLQMACTHSYSRLPCRGACRPKAIGLGVAVPWLPGQDLQASWGPTPAAVLGRELLHVPSPDSPLTGDVPTKAAETWHLSGPGLQGFICLCVCSLVLHFLGICAQPSGLGLPTCCLVGLWSFSIPVLPALLMNYPKV